MGFTLLPFEAMEFIPELLNDPFELLIFLLKCLDQIEQLSDVFPCLIEVQDEAHVKVVQHGAAS